jgi:serine/threonine protein kinase
MPSTVVQNITARFHRASSQSTGNDRENAHLREEEKQKLANWEAEKRPLEIEEIIVSPEKKVIGHSSKVLKRNDFDLITTLGTGTFARVWLVKLSQRKNPEDQKKVFALKILRKTDVIRLKQVEHVRNERNVLAAVAGHPFITTMVASFQDHDNLYMLLEYCPGGEVFSYLRRARRFNEHTSQFYAAEIVLILEFLHETEGVAYRDLKPENILIDADGHLKLVDFGFAKKIENRGLFLLPSALCSLLPLQLGSRLRSRSGLASKAKGCVLTIPLTIFHARRRDIHTLRNTRVSRARGHPQHRPRHCRRLVGLWNSRLRISRRPAPLLGPKPDQNLRANRRR